MSSFLIDQKNRFLAFFSSGLILAPLSGLASDHLCEDQLLRGQFEGELDASKVPNECPLSEAAEFGQIEFTTRNGEKLKTSCCVALHIEMQEAAQDQIDLKKSLCEESRNGAQDTKCNSPAECLDRNIKSMEAAQRMNDKLANAARGRQKVGGECLVKVADLKERVAEDIRKIRKAHGLVGEDRKREIDSLPNMGLK